MHPISSILCLIYDELRDRGQVSFLLGDRHRTNIDSIVKTVNATYFGVERFKTPEEKAVAYLCLIIKDHPVTDGNKRLAIFWFKVFCDVSDIEMQPLPFELDVLAVAVERSTEEMDDLLLTVRSIVFNT